MNEVQTVLHPYPLAGGRVYPPVQVILTWRPTRPHEVTLTAPGAAPGAAWVFARDLLAAGLDAPAGLGDVSVLPDLAAEEERVELVLSSPSGRMALPLPVAVLRSFLAATWDIVPADHETRVWEAAWTDGMFPAGGAL
ncbi:SsgA family sporulation/cell division regulator [Pseudonocardia hispaniensis]|uniref:SsgA family sporulation/cell division regulator n=1 Tax=Pseudonocardia hispaniensis TaxID=904933 RepID=A0ABW1IWZ7_9PSEU